MRNISYLNAIKEAMREEMERDSDVFLIGEDIGRHGGAFGVTRGLFDRFGQDRVIDTPISEGTIISCAIGAAIAGMRPVAEIMFIDFATLAMDQIANQAAKIRHMLGGQVTIPIVVRLPEGSGYKGTAAQHSQCLEAWFAHIPGLKVVMPSNPYNAKGLFKSAVRDNNPVIFIEQKSLYSMKGPVPEYDYTVPIGQSQITREGSDITIATYSYMTKVSLELAEKLSEENINVEVIDILSLKPLDIMTVIKSVKKTGRLVVAHEACKTFGVGAEISALVCEQAFEYLKAPIERVAALDVPIPFNYAEERAVIVNETELEQAIRKVLAYRKVSILSM
ncbi:MAG: alpha-ketoacid dehydrogenase subunit beta [Clostridiales bacterium]|nr:alpha-ketoacid dehydrogenase subunit beta [Clostridiales bacterium]